MNLIRTKKSIIDTVVSPKKLNISNGVKDHFKLKVWLIAVAIISMVLVVNYFTLAWTEPLVSPPGGTGFARYSLDAYGGLLTNVVYVNNAGNVGIGTLSPNNKLEINGGALSFYRTGNWTAVGLDYDATDDVLRLRSNNGSSNLNQTNMVINRVSGNVGIGTTNPQAPLHTVLNTSNINGLQEVGRFTAQTSGTASFTNPAFGSGIFLYSEHVNGGVYPMAYVGGVISSAAINTGMLSFGNYELGVRTERLLQTGNTVFLKSPYVSVSNGDMTPGVNGRYYDGTNNQFEVLKSYAATAGLQSTMGIIAYSDGTADDTFGTSLIFANEGSAGLTYRRAYIGSLATGGAGNGALVLGTYNSSVAYERLRINKDGNVGIGTASPGSKLDVNGAVTIESGCHPSWVAGALNIDSCSGSARIQAGAGGSYLPLLLNQNGGNVGIGTAPHAAFAVAGGGDDTLAGVDNIMIYTNNGTPRIQLEDAGSKRWVIDNYIGNLRFILMPSTNGAAESVPLQIDNTGKVQGLGGGFIIGGTYQRDDNNCCMNANPLTGGCSCPSGYSPYSMTRSRMGCGDAAIGSVTFMCR